MLEASNFIKKETLAQVFPVNFVKFLRTPFLTEHLWWLLLHSVKQSKVVCVLTQNSIAVFDYSIISVCLLEMRLCWGDDLLFDCFCRSPTTTSTSEKSNANLNNLLKYLSGMKYSHQCFVGDFNFSNISWFTWSTPQNGESKEAQLTETIRDCYLYQHLGTNTESNYW